MSTCQVVGTGHVYKYWPFYRFPPTVVKCDASEMSHHQFSLDSLRHRSSSVTGTDLPSIVQHCLSGNLQNLADLLLRL